MIAKLHQQHQAQMTMKIPLKKLSKNIYAKKQLRRITFQYHLKYYYKGIQKPQQQDPIFLTHVSIRQMLMRLPS